MTPDLVESPSPSQRITHLDLLRASLMLLGIVIHSSFVFITEQRWLIASFQTHVFFDYLTLSIHSFRMPAFYLLSGFLFALVLARSTVLPFFITRAKRILIPLFTAGVLINTLQIYVLDIASIKSTVGLVNSQSCGSAAELYQGSCWEFHLWFLIVLFYYFLFFIPIVHFASKINIKIFVFGPQSYLWPLTLISFIVIIQATYSAAYRGYFDFINYLPFLSDPKFYYYLPFFLFGVLLHYSKSRLDAWTRAGPVFLVLFILSWAALLWGFNPQEDTISGYLRWSGRYNLWLYAAVAFQTTAFLVVMASKLPNIPAALATYVSDASYTIYLFHHILVFSFAYLFLNTFVPSGLQFVSILMLSAIASWAVHHYIVFRSPVAACLVNGRTERLFGR